MSWTKSLWIGAARGSEAVFLHLLDLSWLLNLSCLLQLSLNLVKRTHIAFHKILVEVLRWIRTSYTGLIKAIQIELSYKRVVVRAFIIRSKKQLQFWDVDDCESIIFSEVIPSYNFIGILVIYHRVQVLQEPRRGNNRNNNCVLFYKLKIELCI